MFTTSLLFAAAALPIEAAFGYPDALFRAVRHPVVWVGALIATLDRRMNRAPGSRMAGVAAIMLILLASAGGAWLVTLLLHAALPQWAAVVLLAVLGSTLLAQRSLDSHVAAVGDALACGLPQGRAAVAHIVGRDPQTLDAAAIARAAIESLAENFADGVVAPGLWGALLGLPGMMGYKALNTADSMIGHRTPRHERFGWASARLDDLVNLPASRLAAFWIVLAAAMTPGADAAAAARAVRRDARRHRSPNAGWPEAAMAGALGMRLAGPRSYGGVVVQDGWMGDGRSEAGPDDIRHGLKLYRRACALQIAVYWAIAVSAVC